MFGWSRKYKPQPYIAVDDAGVELREDAGNTIWRCRWSEVVEIAAWKDDVFGYDIICVGFRVGMEPSFYWADEERGGWDEFLEVLQARFQIDDSWWSKVAFPAFERNWTVLWRRTDSNSSQVESKQE